MEEFYNEKFVDTPNYENLTWGEKKMIEDSVMFQVWLINKRIKNFKQAIVNEYTKIVSIIRSNFK